MKNVSFNLNYIFVNIFSFLWVICSPMCIYYLYIASKSVAVYNLQQSLLDCGFLRWRWRVVAFNFPVIFVKVTSNSPIFVYTLT